MNVWHTARWLTLCCGWLLPACASAPPAEGNFDLGWGPDVEGPNAAAAAAPSPDLIPEELRKPWSRTNLLPTLTTLAATEPTEHLGGGYVREVLLNDAAGNYSRGALTTPLTAGALLLQRHYATGDRDQTVSYFGMERVTTGWRFFVLDGDLRLATKSSPPACVRCHSEAPFHSLFGPPQAPPEPTTQ